MKASILFITYNHGRFVAEAIRSAMAQDYPELELVVCDDSSRDDTRAILEKELERCPPHITIVRAHSPKNGGLIANFNRGFSACTGEVVIPMAGDDVSLPQRVSRIVAEFKASPACMLIYSNWTRIDDEGNTLPGSGRFKEDRTFRYGRQVDCVYAGGKGPGSTAAYRAELFRTFGPLDQVPRPEDRSCFFRALLLGEVRYLAEPLVRWRTHASNLSNYQGGVDTPGGRKRILRDLLHRQNYGRQFRKDLETASRASLVPPALAKRLLFIILHDRERERLRRYSLSLASWKLWLGSAVRLMGISRSIRDLSRIVFSELPIRVSSKRRERRWSIRIRKGRP